MAIYEDSLAEIGTPFTTYDADFFVESGDPWLSFGVRWQELLPIALALVAIATFILVRPKVTAGDLANNGGNLANAEEGIETIVSVENQTASNIQVSDISAEIGGINSKLSPIFTEEVRFWEPQIMQWSATYGVDPNIVATIMQIESCGNPDAESYAGAQGLFQVMPFHFVEGESMLDPNTNAMRGLAFFNEQLRYTNGDILLSFAGYNGGYAASGGNYATWPNETQRYYYWAKGIYEEASNGFQESPTLSEWLAAGGAAGCQRAAGRLGL
jgi:hypothetical protein